MTGAQILIECLKREGGRAIKKLIIYFTPLILCVVLANIAVAKENLLIRI